MLFMQLKSDISQGPQIEAVKCNKCGKTSLHLCSKVKYLALELFNLPLIVVGRQYQFCCTCGNQQESTLKTEQLNALKRKMWPRCYFLLKNIGAIIAMMAVLYFWQQYQQQVAATKDLVANPKVHDFYFIDYHSYNPDSHPKYRYTTMKAIEITEQSVTVRLSNFAKGRKAPAFQQLKSDRAMLDGFFSKKTITLDKAQLARLVDEGIIYEVRRPSAFKIDGWFVARPEVPEQWVYQYNKDNQEGISLFRGELGYAQDFVGAFAAFTRAAEANDPSGQNNLAEMYRDGLGTEQNTEKALYWFKQAAAAGHRLAIDNYRKLCEKTIDCDPALVNSNN